MSWDPVKKTGVPWRTLEQVFEDEAESIRRVEIYRLAKDKQDRVRFDVVEVDPDMTSDVVADLIATSAAGKTVTVRCHGARDGHEWFSRHLVVYPPSRPVAPPVETPEKPSQTPPAAPGGAHLSVDTIATEDVLRRAADIKKMLSSAELASMKEQVRLEAEIDRLRAQSSAETEQREGWLATVARSFLEKHGDSVAAILGAVLTTAVEKKKEVESDGEPGSPMDGKPD